MTSWDRELGFAMEVAALGARIALGHFRKELSPQMKKDGTWVTEADWATEAQIRLRIARTFPDHNIFGEEEGLSRAGGGAPVDAGPTWIVDPIDGTNNFIAGIPIWATLVGLRSGDEYVVGAVAAPALQESYDAAQGAGARFNGSAIRTDEAASMGDATALYADAASMGSSRWSAGFKRVTEGARRTRGFGDFWGHMLVARGAAHIMVEPEIAEWDAAALIPIVREAGGVITHIDGDAWRGPGSCLTTTSALHDEVVSMFNLSGDAPPS